MASLSSLRRTAHLPLSVACPNDAWLQCFGQHSAGGFRRRIDAKQRSKRHRKIDRLGVRPVGSQAEMLGHKMRAAHEYRTRRALHDRYLS